MSHDTIGEVPAAPPAKNKSGGTIPGLLFKAVGTVLIIGFGAYLYFVGVN